MARFDSKALWQYSHSAAIVLAALMFTASFVCTLLWTNSIVPNATSVAPIQTSTFSQFSGPVSTFRLTYGVALFGTIWNSVLFVTLVILERDVLPISTIRLRYEVEKAACMVSIVGNAIYSIACIALMSTLARLAAGAGTSMKYGATDRRAGFGATAAFAGLAGAAAVWACLMDALHAQSSSYRRVVKDEPLDSAADEAEKAPTA